MPAVPRCIRAHTVVIGAGPAGFALLAAAERMGVLGDLSRRGLVVVDSSAGGRTGSLRRYQVTADTPAKVFQETLEPLVASRPEIGRDPSLRSLMSRPSADELPLATAAAALQAGTDLLLDRVECEGGRVLRAVDVVSVRRGADELHLTARGPRGAAVEIRAPHAVFATGGTPAVPPDLAEVCPGAVHSDRLLTRPEPDVPASVQRLAIIGSSHSAFAVVGRLLAETPFRDHVDITVLCRHPPKVTYESEQDATEDGASFTAADVCPQTGRVFRFGGLRMRAAATFRAVRDGHWPRVRLVDLSSQEGGWPRLCREADLVVAATGYRSKALEILAIPGAGWDTRCRLRDGKGQVVPGLYGIGLSTRVRVLSDGGEPSYRGTVDGVWFYERVVAPIIVEQVLGDT